MRKTMMWLKRKMKMMMEKMMMMMKRLKVVRVKDQQRMMMRMTLNPRSKRLSEKLLEMSTFSSLLSLTCPSGRKTWSSSRESITHAPNGRFCRNNQDFKALPS